jgi:diphthine synthase
MDEASGWRGRLVFVGLGLNNENGISLEGIREAEEADIAFAESYTSALRPGSLEEVEKRIRKRIDALTRQDVEDGVRIIESCIGRRVVLLVPGDPMTATTHVDLRLRAHRQRIETSLVHGSSTMTAVPGVLGLQHYKFGRTTTIPFPSEGYSPTSPFEIMAENMSRGLHTLALLDIDAENSRYMTANEGMHLLIDME